MATKDTDGNETLEGVTARDLRSKAKWHMSRAGKDKNAKLGVAGPNLYRAELMERGVTDHEGKQSGFAFR